MSAMKSILKSLLIGGLYFLMSFTVYQLGYALVDTFKDMMIFTGINAVLFFFAGLFLIAIMGVTLFFMGAIPLALSYEVKELEREKGKPDDVCTS